MEKFFDKGILAEEEFRAGLHQAIQRQPEFGAGEGRRGLTRLGEEGGNGRRVVTCGRGQRDQGSLIISGHDPDERQLRAVGFVLDPGREVLRQHPELDGGRQGS